MLKKILFNLQVFFEKFRSFLVRFILKLLIIIFICVIIHTVLKMSEISTNYTGTYKKLIGIDGNKLMNVYQTGNGEKAIVILPGFGTPSPIIHYKALTEGLKDEYKVVVIEYYGYGFSTNANKERKNEIIAKEINTALTTIGIDKCVFLAHSTSNLYASKYASMYPDNVEGIISLDGIYPSEIENNYLRQKYEDNVRNTKITAVFELTGFERALSYIKPDEFYIDYMEKSNIYTDEDIKIYRNRIASSYLTTPMIKEIGMLEKNMKELSKYKYASNLPVLQILASDTVKEYDSIKSETNKTLKQFANDMISNPSIQSTVEIEGGHMLHFTSPNEVIERIKIFLQNF